VLAGIAGYLDFAFFLRYAKYSLAVFAFKISMRFSVMPYPFTKIYFIFEFQPYITVGVKLIAPRVDIFRKTPKVYPQQRYYGNGQYNCLFQNKRQDKAHH
jgi:hypothetical protein